MTSHNNQISRRKLFKYGAAIGGLAASNLGGVTVGAQSSTSFLIKNATIMTMDEDLGELIGDILVRGGKIAQVGANISADSDEIIDGTDHIILPGFVDGHRHLWQTAMRNRQDIFGYGNYVPQGINRFSPSYNASDMEISAYMGGLEALNAGVTSAVDFCHNSITPEHSEAALRGNRRSGIGGYFCYSFAGTPNHGPGDTVNMAERRPAADGTWRIEHAKSMKAEHFAAKDANIKFGICTSSFEYFAAFAPDNVINEMNNIRDIDPELISIHVHNHGKDFRLMPFMVRENLVDDRVLLAHANGVTLEEMKQIAPFGVSICNTPESEAPYGEKPSFGNGFKAGIDIALGADSVIFNGGDMFSAMRMTLQFQRFTEAPAHDIDKSSHVTHPMDILKAATISGARAMGIADKVGSITAGKQADIIMIDTRKPHFQPMTFPLAAVVFNAGVGDITNVWVRGKPVKRDGKMLAADYADAKAELNEAIAGIAERANTITLL